MRERITYPKPCGAGARPRKSVSSLRSTSSMHTQSSSIRALFLSGPTGRLEALLNAGSETLLTPHWSAIPILFMAGRYTTKSYFMP